MYEFALLIRGLGFMKTKYIIIILKEIDIWVFNCKKKNSEELIGLTLIFLKKKWEY